MNEVFLNGKFIPASEACISVMDRGFLFGDGVYEVIPAYGGRLFRLEHHLRRLENSLHAIRMTPPLKDKEWELVLGRLVEQLPGDDQSVYLQVTRGASKERDHAIPTDLTPTLFAMTKLFTAADPALAEHGIRAVTLDDIRWQLCNVKTTALLGNVLLKAQADDHNASECILIRKGNAMEGAASNLFLIRSGEIITPPKSNHLLPGITRDLIIELAQTHKLPWVERDIPAEQLSTADEIWMTSSTREIMPVVELNGTQVGTGKPSPLFKQMRKLYSDYIQQLRTN
ncbi:MAG: D-amino acid aminotransferase [Gammaproteobacteria bacterium]|nr:D-amino acid aminotransferase [Gammaproteobacteria bacterium]